MLFDVEHSGQIYLFNMLKDECNLASFSFEQL